MSKTRVLLSLHNGVIIAYPDFCHFLLQGRRASASTETSILMQVQGICMVPRRGLEPPQDCSHKYLKLACLPVSPPRRTSIISFLCRQCQRQKNPRLNKPRVLSYHHVKDSKNIN